MPGREGSRCLTRQEQVASYSWALVMTAATATTLWAAVLLRRMSLSRSRVFPGVCTKAHKRFPGGTTRRCSYIAPRSFTSNAKCLKSDMPLLKSLLHIFAHVCVCICICVRGSDWLRDGKVSKSSQALHATLFLGTFHAIICSFSGKRMHNVMPPNERDMFVPGRPAPDRELEKDRCAEVDTLPVQALCCYASTYLRQGCCELL